MSVSRRRPGLWWQTVPRYNFTENMFLDIVQGAAMKKTPLQNCNIRETSHRAVNEISSVIEDVI